MDFDMKRYDKRKFHEEDEIDKKIKALMLLYDYQVFRKNLSSTNQLALLDDWILKFTEFEFYEIIPVFKLRRSIILKHIVLNKKENMTFLEYLAMKIKRTWRKTMNYFKKRLKK